MKINLAGFLAAALVLTAVFSCSPKNRPDTDDAEGPPRITTALVAASAKNAVEEVAAQFKNETGLEVVVSAGPSNALASQIVAGGDADLFLSANKQWADVVAQAGQSLRQRNLLTNGLVLVVPKGNPAGVRTPDDLNSAQVKKIALAGEKVPAGTYAQQALSALKLLNTLEHDKKIVRGHDVRSTLTYIERGEADAGVVFTTDAMISQDVEVVHTFDPRTYDQIVYPVVLLKAADGNKAAQRFFDYLGSQSAVEVFRRHGFDLLPE